MTEKRRGLGRGLGALIPSAQDSTGQSVPSRPVDLFFPRPSTKSVPEPDSEQKTGDPEGDVPAQATLVELETANPSTGEQRGVDKAAKPAQGKKKPAAKKASAAPEDAQTAETAPASSVDAAESESAPAQAPGTSGRGRAAATKKAGREKAQATPTLVDSTPVEPSQSNELVPVPGAQFAELNVADIRPNPRQPRTEFDEQDMAELVHSIREIGVLQPIVVRRNPSGESGYELIMGERRWRASKEAGQETIPAIIRETNDDALLRDALLENLHRSQLNPIEEAAAYQQLLTDFGATHEELADRIGRSRPQVSNTIRLLKLPALVQRRVAAGVLSAGHARALLGLSDQGAMERLAQRIVSEGLSVRATEEAVVLYVEPKEPKAGRTPRNTARHERLDYLASSLSDRLDTNVKISLGARKGRVSIEFASVDDLNRIMDVINPSQ